MTLHRMLLAAAALASAPVARAQMPAGDPSLGLYGHLRLGLYVPKASDLDGFNNGLDVEAAIGYRMHRNFAVEGGLGYYSSSTDTMSAGGVSVKGNFSDIPLTVTGKAILPAGAAELYGLVGIGIHNAKLSADVSGAVSGSTSASDTAFGVHFGVGASFEVAPRVALSLDVRYLVAQATFNAGGQSTTGDIDALFLTGGLLYRF